MGLKISWVKKQKKKESEEKKMMRHRIQYTKVVMNVVLILVIILSLGSLYINLKTGNSMDSIVIEALQTLWKCVGFYGVKSFSETFSEKYMEYKFKESEKETNI